jgi:nitrite reductase/ring-hydroxylating ferredoxin subunit
MTWEKTISVSELKGRPRVFKRLPRQIALFLVGERPFAVDNRCPHEGYPLAEGKVDGACVLTCNWHNWKFRLEDGECVLGGDHVRAYPAKVEDGHVWVDFADPPAEAALRRVLEGLRKAFSERDFGRICREVTRLHVSGLDPLVAVRRAVEWSHDRLEFGSTHAYAAAADWLALARTFAGDWEKQLICLAETVDHMAFDSLRNHTYPYAPAGPAYTRQAFLDAVEGERTAEAEGMVRRALADGLHWPDLEEAFVAAALAHYNDFGHSLIYVCKNAQLIALAGRELEPYLLPALARHLCYTTREDLIPEFRGYAEALAGLAHPADLDEGPLDAQALFPLSTRDALLWVVRHIGSHRPQTLYNALLEALARNLLHFDINYDMAFDGPVRQNVGWLDFTHGVTFANAARDVCTRHPQYPVLGSGPFADGLLSGPQPALPRPGDRRIRLASAGRGGPLRRDERAHPRPRHPRPHLLGPPGQDDCRRQGGIARRFPVVPRCVAGGFESFPSVAAQTAARPSPGPAGDRASETGLRGGVRSVEMMKKTRTAKKGQRDKDMLPEYHIDYRMARRNRFAARVKQGCRVVVLDPGVADVFAT